MVSSRLKYRPEIDGLRALAVAPVILFHAGIGPFEGGFVGVDVFFVISGYLITMIIVSEMAAGEFTLANFYERRARRILPALIFVVAACIPFAYMWMLPRDLTDFFQSMVAVATFSSNVHFWVKSGYFAPIAEVNPLLHTWSLAVEEQYYILFPLLLLGLRKVRESAEILVLTALFVLSLAFSQEISHSSPSAAFYLLPSRAWELLIGVLAALYLYKHGFPRHQILSGFASLLGVMLIAVSVFTFTEQTPFPGVFALVPTLGTVLVIVFAIEGTWVRAFLGMRLLVGLGLISYSAYLWHQPLLAFARYRLFEMETWISLVLVAATVLLAALTWKFIELPFRNRSRVATKTIFRGGVVAMAGIVAVGLIGSSPTAYSGSNTAGILDYEPDNRLLRSMSWVLLRTLSSDVEYSIDRNRFDMVPWFEPADERQRMLLVGDSYSKDLWNVLNHSWKVTSAFQVARFGVQIGALLEDRRLFESPNYRESHVIVVVSKYDRRDIASMREVVEQFIADGKAVVLVKEVFLFPEYRGRTSNLADKIIFEATEDGLGDSEETARRSNRLHYNYFREAEDIWAEQSDNAALEAVAADYPGVRIIDRMKYICSDASRECYSLGSNLNKYFYDSRHHTLDGAKFFGARVDKIGWLDKVLDSYSARN